MIRHTKMMTWEGFEASRTIWVHIFLPLVGIWRCLWGLGSEICLITLTSNYDIPIWLFSHVAADDIIQFLQCSFWVPRIIYVDRVLFLSSDNSPVSCGLNQVHPSSTTAWSGMFGVDHVSVNMCTLQSLISRYWVSLSRTSSTSFSCDRTLARQRLGRWTVWSS